MTEFYNIPINPKYSENIRKLQDSDPVSASTVVNPLVMRLIENTAALERLLQTVRTDLVEVKDRLAFVVGSAAPEDKTKLWIDTGAESGGLKYWNGTAWVHVPVAYT